MKNKKRSAIICTALALLMTVVVGNFTVFATDNGIVAEWDFGNPADHITETGEWNYERSDGNWPLSPEHAIVRVDENLNVSHSVDGGRTWIDGPLVDINLGGSEEWTPPPGWGEATPIASAVIVNGTEIEFYAYGIYGNNFFRLRDLAYILNGTEKQFDVAWNGELNAVVITSGQPYTVIGGEMALGNSTGSFTPTPSDNRFILDGEEIILTSYLINGNNFVRLRDVGAALDFWVGFDGRVLVYTSYPYGARLFIDQPDSSESLGSLN